MAVVLEYLAAEAYRGVKNPLVFLFPGIKKYRRKLLKGDHYFDSVSDVLKKVAFEPELLILESEENGARTPGKENGTGSGSEPTSDEDFLSSCFLSLILANETTTVSDCFRWDSFYRGFYGCALCTLLLRPKRMVDKKRKSNFDGSYQLKTGQLELLIAPIMKT